MIIAKIGDFELRLKTYFGEHQYMTDDIELCKGSRGDGSVYTIASFNEDGELISCGGRLMENIIDGNDAFAVRELAEIGQRITNTDIIPSGYGEMITVKTWGGGKSILEEPDTIRKYPTERDIAVYEAVADMDCNSKYYWNECDAIDYIMDSYEDCVRRGYVEDKNRDEIREILKASGEIKDVGAYWKIDIK